MNVVVTTFASSLALTLAIGSAAAQSAAAPAGKTIGLDAGLALPTGDWSDAVGLGLGALVRFEMPLGGKLVLTGRAGYLQHLSKDSDTGFGGSASSSSSQIPLLGGVRYVLRPDTASTMYGAAELGLDMFRSSVEAGGQSQSDSDTNLALTLGGGYRAGKLDLRAGLLFADVGNLGDSMALMATVGYQLTAL